MTDHAVQAPVGIGDNRPPEPAPYETAKDEINDLYGEAKLWLDGKAVATQELADDIAKLINMIRAARKRADDARKVENRPFDTGKTEVQARYNPLLKQADRATEVCKSALTPWLQRLDAEKRATAAAARLVAEEQAQIARDAHQAAALDNLKEREAAEALIEDAKMAERAANRAERDTAKAAGGVGRAVGLRTIYTPILTDAVAAARHYWKIDRQAMTDFLTSLAEKDVQRGEREIPGFDVRGEQTAV
jgi:hypothetical protein